MKFQVGKDYISKGITYLCINTTETEVTFRKVRRINKVTGQRRYSRQTRTLKIIGKKEQRAVIYSWIVDGKEIEILLEPHNILFL